MDLIGLAGGVLIPLIALALERGWIPPKYQMIDVHPLSDPVASRIFGPAAAFDSSPRQARVVLKHMIPAYKAKGFRAVRVAWGNEFRWGREVVWRGSASDGSIQDGVLMARPVRAATQIEPPHSGVAPHYVSATTEIPPGIDPEAVLWPAEARAGNRRRVLDVLGREWRFRESAGDLVLCWRE